jgi:NTE family protein
VAATTALVLSGGCLRGFAQIGVLKALVSAGIRIDLVVGSSVGAVVGALFAAGCTPAEIERAAHEVVVARLKRWAFSRHGLWEGSGVEALMRRHLPCRRIEDFPMRFAAVATDVATGRLAVFTAGDAGRAVVASAAMPGFFLPAVVAGRSCVDGCLVSPLPVMVARSMGAQRVIAVNTLHPGGGLAGGVLDVLMRSSRLMVHALAAHESGAADVVIAPELGVCGGASAGERQRLIDAGERCAREKLAERAAEEQQRFAVAGGMRLDAADEQRVVAGHQALGQTAAQPRQRAHDPRSAGGRALDGNAVEAVAYCRVGEPAGE